MKRLFGVLLLVLCLAQPLNAAMIIGKFSDLSSDSTPASVLDAEVTFTKFGNTLSLTIENLSSYKIAELYFNSDPTLFGLAFDNSFTPINPAWSVSGLGFLQLHGADGMGRYNWKLDFGSGNNRLAAGSITDIDLTMLGTTSLSGIASTWSSNPPGSISALAVLKFEAGPFGDSAFGASKTFSYEEDPPFGGPPPISTPEPTSMALLASGVLGLVFGAWRRRRIA